MCGNLCFSVCITSSNELGTAVMHGTLHWAPWGRCLKDVLSCMQCALGQKWDSLVGLVTILHHTDAPYVCQPQLLFPSTSSRKVVHAGQRRGMVGPKLHSTSEPNWNPNPGPPRHVWEENADACSLCSRCGSTPHFTTHCNIIVAHAPTSSSADRCRIPVRVVSFGILKPVS